LFSNFAGPDFEQGAKEQKNIVGEAA
jgi:hypothetical protein